MRELSVAEQRYQAVLAVISDGLSISQVAEKVGVSRQTLSSLDMAGMACALTVSCPSHDQRQA
jgi:DNA-binding XRE family transcriptional regulator